MYSPPTPENEAERLAALEALELLDTDPEERFDRISRLAVDLFQVPVAYVSLIARERQWFKSICGLDLKQTERKDALCAYTIAAEELVVVTDASTDERFRENIYVTGPPGVRFYLGQPLLSSDGLPVGTFCVLDFEPRDTTDEMAAQLVDLAKLVEAELNMRDLVKMQQALVRQQEKLRVMNDYIRSVLGRYVAVEVAEEILSSPEAHHLGGELRTVTILMCDLRGFCALSEQFPPKRVVALLNRYLTAMVDIISEYGGTVDQILGDGMMVVFGAPVKMDDGPARAVACALRMQLAMEEFNEESARRGEPHLEMGVGINTGQVVVGNIGSQSRMKYSVVGSPVNLAARIESCSVGGQILASASTLLPLSDIVRVDGRLRVKLKGFDAPTIYEVGGLGGEYNIYLPERTCAITQAPELKNFQPWWPVSRREPEQPQQPLADTETPTS